MWDYLFDPNPNTQHAIKCVNGDSSKSKVIRIISFTLMKRFWSVMNQGLLLEEEDHNGNQLLHIVSALEKVYPFFRGEKEKKWMTSELGNVIGHMTG